MTQYEKLGKLLDSPKPFRRWLFWKAVLFRTVGSRTRLTNPLAVFLAAKGINVQTVARYDIHYKVSMPGSREKEDRYYPVPRWGVDLLKTIGESGGPGTTISARECRRLLDESFEKRMQVELVKRLYSGEADSD